MKTIARHRCLWHFIVLCALAATAGCRRSDTVAVNGQVTLDGTALSSGTIMMIPINKNAGPSIGCEIVDGRYNVPASRGPLRGTKYRVEIRSIDPDSGSKKNPLSGTFPVFLDRVPAAYNSRSQLELVVPEDASRLENDFQLRNQTR
jgi:hypothetical protein